MNNFAYVFGGMLIGFIFFGGLKYTLYKIQTVKRPALLIIFSYLFRMTLLLGGLALFALYAGVTALLFGVLGVTLMMAAILLLSGKKGEA